MKLVTIERKQVVLRILLACATLSSWLYLALTQKSDFKLKSPINITSVSSY